MFPLDLTSPTLPLTVTCQLWRYRDILEIIYSSLAFDLITQHQAHNLKDEWRLEYQLVFSPRQLSRILTNFITVESDAVGFSHTISPPPPSR